MGKNIFSISIVVYLFIVHNMTRCDKKLGIIGGGVAGLSAAIYGGNGKIETLVFKGPQAGGQLARAALVENIPGLRPMPGTEFIVQLEKQAQEFGAQLIDESVVSVTIQQEGRRFLVTTQEGGAYEVDALVIASGARPQTLNIPGEDTYWGKGLSTCALCDAIFAAEKDVVIIGGGDSAIEEALQLVGYAQKITLIVRGNQLRASPRMQEKLSPFTHIFYQYNSEVKEIIGDSSAVTAVIVKNNKTGFEEVIPTQRIFFAIGHIPETSFIKDIVPCDVQGYIQLLDGQKTCTQGIFAAGDATNKRHKQAIIASGNAVEAALDAINYLRDID